MALLELPSFRTEEPTAQHLATRIENTEPVFVTLTEMRAWLESDEITVYTNAGERSRSKCHQICLRGTWHICRNKIFSRYGLFQSQYGWGLIRVSEENLPEAQRIIEEWRNAAPDELPWRSQKSS